MSVDSITAEFARNGVTLRKAWLEACLVHIRGIPAASQYDAVYHHLLHSNLSQSVERSLPVELKTWENQELEGPHLVQFTELVDIGKCHEDRQKSDRMAMVKAKISDGNIEVAGFEYKTIPNFSSCKAGCKAIIQRVPVRHGMLMLTDRNCRLLGGEFQRLDGARAEDEAAVVVTPATQTAATPVQPLAQQPPAQLPSHVVQAPPTRQPTQTLPVPKSPPAPPLQSSSNITHRRVRPSSPRLSEEEAFSDCPMSPDILRKPPSKTTKRTQNTIIPLAEVSISQVKKNVKAVVTETIKLHVKKQLTELTVWIEDGSCPRKKAVLSSAVVSKLFGAPDSSLYDMKKHERARYDKIRHEVTLKLPLLEGLMVLSSKKISDGEELLLVEDIQKPSPDAIDAVLTQALELQPKKQRRL